MGFSNDFLMDFYHKLDKKKLPKQVGCFGSSMVELPCNPPLDSLYISLHTYLKWNIEPAQDIIKLKLMEGVYTLLTTDNRFYNSLFGSCTQNHVSQIKRTTCIKKEQGCTITDIYIEAGCNDKAESRQMPVKLNGSSLLN